MVRRWLSVAVTVAVWLGLCAASAAAGPAHHQSCGHVALRSPPGFASGIQATGIGCARARRLVAGSPSRRYLYTGGRFRTAGLSCRATTAAFFHTFYVCRRGRVEITYSIPR